MPRFTLLVVSLLFALPRVSAAQTPSVDPRWAPYLGCWQLGREVTADPLLDLFAIAARERPADQRRDDVLICVTPSEEKGAVAQQTVLNGETVLDEVIPTDGTERTSEDAGCRATRRAEWSSTGRQLFTHGVISCENQPERRLSGMSFIMPGPTWVDVQMADVNGRRSVRVRRYSLSREQARVNRSGLASVSPAPLARWTIEEVKEAVGRTAPEVVQAALVEVGTKLPLSSERLLELDRAGVPGPVVDVMVALSFPEKFVIERPRGSYAYGYGGGAGIGYADPWLIASQYGWLSMYSPFGYQYYGSYDPFFGPGWGWVIVNPPGDGGGNDLANGRVVNGAGYTRVRPRDPDPARVAGGLTDRSGSSAGRSGDSGSGSSGGSSGDSGGVSSGGYSSGGSSGGRTAVRRPPGGR